MNANRLQHKSSFHTRCSEKIFVEQHKVKVPQSMASCHYHSNYEIYYLFSGERYYFIQEEMYHVKKGDLIIIAPNVIHATFNAKDCPYERFLMTFTKENVEDVVKTFPDINFFNAIEKNTPVLHLSLEEQLLAEAVIRKINDTENEAKRKFLLSQLLFLTSTHQSEDNEEDGKYFSQTHKIITEIMAHINNNFSQNLTLNSMSSAFFIDPCYLSRTFKKTVGISFVDYVNNVRVMEAKKLLKSSNKSILSISEEVGFKSNTHFGRIFKKITGTSPLQYKKNNKKGL